jgi:uncharacterized membrane protein
MKNFFKLSDFLISPKGLKDTAQRFWEIDMLRGVAILMMVVYHSAWDLSELGRYSINLSGNFWHYFQTCTATLFITIAGISLTLNQSPAHGAATDNAFWKKNLFHGFKIFLWGMVISLITYIFEPNSYVKFGVLHLIGFSIMISYPFLRFRKFNLFLGILIILVRQIVLSSNLFILNVPWLDWVGLEAFARPSFDFFSVFPWFGVVLIGIFIGNTLYFDRIRHFSLPEISDFSLVKVLRLLGNNSLLIYMGHQPIILLFLILGGVIQPQALF